MIFSKKIIFLFILIHIFFCFGSQDCCQANSVQEDQIKAVFIFNLMNFITWPDRSFSGKNDNIKVGVIGNNRLGTILKKVVSEELIQGRKIKMTLNEDSLNLCDYHLIFISSTKKMIQNLKRIRNKNCSFLTVGDASDFVHKGGIISLVREDKRIRVEINAALAKKARIKISSKLMRISTIINRKIP